MDFEKTINLRKPVKLGDLEYSTLELREPTAGELEKAANATTNMGVVINLISLVAKVPRKVVESLCQRDLKEAGDFLDGFSAGDPPTGETDSLM
ncbi:MULTISPECIES: phage tail assembly protein [unclassified Variovorax]|uniref:phage tail assembly protein n=1 Tax=unclassified Variovorax TaxID=663243 RepID=UPI000AEA554F|nr:MULTISPECIES: phage tail assembly protein [unclassified Variovorax]PNG56532.1 hypothetical protein CHC07_02951 [Variovorax sp. B4]PNG57956.1 hypothetical protein CHC06_02954 [Variovorax sp. B2]VTV09576.1 hypothetical protein WDL1CHR_00672 [Variovorax sp. WDL1]